MNKIMMTIIAVVVLALPAAAQVGVPAGAPVDMLNLGSAFGPNSRFQLGIDKSLTAGACVQRELHDGQWLAGPCRDVLVLTRQGVRAMHLGAAVMYNAEHGNATYSLRLGGNVGPVVQAAIDMASSEIPMLQEALGAVHVPKFLGYLGHITTVDYAVGYRPTHTADVIGNLTHGPMVKMDIPLADVLALLKLGL